MATPRRALVGHGRRWRPYGRATEDRKTFRKLGDRELLRHSHFDHILFSCNIFRPLLYIPSHLKLSIMETTVHHKTEGGAWYPSMSL